MYPAVPFSPPTQLAQPINEMATEIHVEDASDRVFPPGPCLATLGIDENGEVILYGAKVGNTLVDVQRGVRGEAKGWHAGTTIARYFSDIDQEAIQENIRRLHDDTTGHVEDDEIHATRTSVSAIDKSLKNHKKKADDMKRRLNDLTEEVEGLGGDCHPFTELDDIQICCGIFNNAGAGWQAYTFPRAFDGMPAVTIQLVTVEGIVMVNNVTRTGFQYQVRIATSGASQTSGNAVQIAYQAIYDGGVD